VFAKHLERTENPVLHSSVLPHEERIEQPGSAFEVTRSYAVLTERLPAQAQTRRHDTRARPPQQNIALLLALTVVAAGVLAAGSSGARQTQRTIGLITQQGADQFFGEIEIHPNRKGESR